MKITEILCEALSSILYHSTSLKAALDIVEQDQFMLTPDMGTETEVTMRKNDKQYYMSFSRSKTGEYHYPVSWIGCMLVVDGDKLNANYSGKAVDYWGKDFNKDEMEDRLYSNKPYITGATKYIKEIHIYIKPDARDQERYSKFVRIARKIYIAAKQKNIQTYFYNDNKAYDLLQKNKSIPISNLELTPIDPTDKPYSYKPRNYFSSYMELLNVDDDKKLSNDAKKVLYNLPWHRESLVTSLKADIHNARTGSSRPNLDKFLNKIKQLGLRTIEEVLTYIENKFNK